MAERKPLAQVAGTVTELGASDTLPAANIPSATTSVKGAVELATDGENAANVAVQGNDSRLYRKRAIGFVIDGGGATITTGTKGYIQIPFACTINSWTILANASGSIVIDIWKDTYANAPPVDADSITASALPTLTSATKATSSTLTGWTTSITAGDVLGFNVDSVTTVQRITIQLEVTPT